MWMSENDIHARLFRDHAELRTAAMKLIAAVRASESSPDEIESLRWRIANTVHRHLGAEERMIYAPLSKALDPAAVATYTNSKIDLEECVSA